MLKSIIEQWYSRGVQLNKRDQYHEKNHGSASMTLDSYQTPHREDTQTEQFYIKDTLERGTRQLESYKKCQNGNFQMLQLKTPVFQTSRMW